MITIQNYRSSIFKGLMLVTVSIAVLACQSPSAEKQSSPDLIDSGIAEILSQIREPVIPDRTINLIEFSGFEPDETGSHDFYLDIKKAIDSLSAQGGGKILFAHSQGAESWIKRTEIYKVEGPIVFKSNIELTFDPNIKLSFEGEPSDYLLDGKGVLRRYEGTMLYSFCPLLYAFNVENIAITANGKNGAMPIIDGNGEQWQKWQYAGEMKREAEGKKMSYKWLRDINDSGLPLRERQYADVDADYYRPELFLPLLSNNILVEGVKFEESPFWMMHPVFCNNLIFRDMMLDGQVVNNDGIDPEACKNVLIERVLFYTHDDNIAIKSGRDTEAREGVEIAGTELEGIQSDYIRDGRIGTDRSENIVIRNNHFKNHYAICIGSEIAAGAKNIYAVDNYAHQDVKMGVFLKSNRTRGGIIEDVYIRNFQINRVNSGDAICIISNYDGDSTSPYPPTFRNIHIEGIKVKSASRGIRIYGWPDAIVENVTLKNIQIDEVDMDSTAFVFNDVANLKLENVNVQRTNYDGNYTKSDKAMDVPRQE